MNFDFNDEHIALRDAVHRFCDSEYPAAKRGESESAELDAARWQKLTELGLTGLLIDPEHGGSGQGAVELMVAATELGRALAGGPYIAQTVLAAGLVARLGDAAQCERWLAPFAAGTLRIAAAIDEDGMRHEHRRTALRATRTGPDGRGEWQLDGHKALVIGGDTAQAFVVLARCSEAASASDADGQPHGQGTASNQGLALFVVAADAPGLQVRAHHTLDGRAAARLEFNAVRVGESDLLRGSGMGAQVTMNGTHNATQAAVQAALDATNAALVAEAAGAMDALIDQCCEHLRTRSQFGAPLAKFQVLQHRVADMVIATEQIHSMACAAAMAVQAGEPVQRARIVAAAKALAARWGRDLALQAIQLHGAMGMTDECRVGHYAKRLMSIGQVHGDHAFHLARLVAAHAASPSPATPSTAPPTTSLMTTSA